MLLPFLVTRGFQKHERQMCRELWSTAIAKSDVEDGEIRSNNNSKRSWSSLSGRKNYSKEWRSQENMARRVVDVSCLEQKVGIIHSRRGDLCELNSSDLVSYPQFRRAVYAHKQASGGKGGEFSTLMITEDFHRRYKTGKGRFS